MKHAVISTSVITKRGAFEPFHSLQSICSYIDAAGFSIMIVGFGKEDTYRTFKEVKRRSIDPFEWFKQLQRDEMKIYLKVRI